ncbi:factor VIII intron 22 protein-like [Dendronephthya gigantea]|uniref:factor VIII intron 22 protein-like n=1 Tax=Dendronephthya gigantea TaxID=151771 RepID=UPI001069CBF8|nr:factor VIII intron 22 protein-like [Dendronephthya gigantea]
MDRDFDVIGKYKAIGSKLKRRFLRKPNVAEASQQFEYLSKTLQQQECLQYAGFCCLAKARCENTLANPTGEVEALTQAARLFLHAEQESILLKCPMFEEHLTEAIHCFNQAIKLHCVQSNLNLAACLCLELGNSLSEMKRYSEAVGYFQQASELQHKTPLIALNSMGLAVKCKLNMGDYDGALALLTEMVYLIHERGRNLPSDSALGSDEVHAGYVDILAECDVTIVLILLLLQPTPQKIRPEHAQMLEKYAWESNGTSSSVDYLSEDLFLLLQSVVMSCQAKDGTALQELEKDLWPFLNGIQKELLYKLVVQMTS